ncbi:MAG: hypothetical protein ACXAC6_12080 [Candidatus Hodarchaeales archaeon]|jgi:hypothetical protein
MKISKFGLKRKKRGIEFSRGIILGFGVVIIIGGLTVISLLQPVKTLTFDTVDQLTSFTDTDSNGAYDKVDFCLKNNAQKMKLVETVTIEVNTAATDLGWTPVANSNTSIDLPQPINDVNRKNNTLSMTCNFETPTGAWTHYRIVISFRSGIQDWTLGNDTIMPEGWMYSTTIETLLSTVYEYP